MGRLRSSEIAQYHWHDHSWEKEDHSQRRLGGCEAQDNSFFLLSLAHREGICEEQNPSASPRPWPTGRTSTLQGYMIIELNGLARPHPVPATSSLVLLSERQLVNATLYQRLHVEGTKRAVPQVAYNRPLNTTPTGPHRGRGRVGGKIKLGGGSPPLDPTCTHVD